MFYCGVKFNFIFFNDLENLNFIVGGIVICFVLNKIIEEIVFEICKCSKKVLFLIIDGRFNIGGDFIFDVMLLCDSCDFEIYIIGVIDSVDE